MKTIKLIAVIFMIIFLASCSKLFDDKSEEPIIEDGILYYEGFVVDIEDYRIIDYDSEFGTDIVLNSEIAGYPVTSINETAFQNKGITSVKINSNFFIWPLAFANNDIHTIIINYDTLYGAMEFYNNPIENIEFAEGINPSEDLLLSIGVPPGEINNVVFSEGFYISLTTNRIVGYDNSYGLDVVIPSTFEYKVFDHSFFADNIDSIGPYAFYKKELSSISFSSDILTIEKFAFSDNDLSEVDITTTNINVLEIMAFANNRLTSFKLNENLTLEGNVFYNNPDLMELTVIDSPKHYLGSYDFIGLNNGYNTVEDFEYLGVLSERFDRFNPPVIHYSDDYIYISQFLSETVLSEELDEFGNPSSETRYYFLLVKYDVDFQEVARFEVDVDNRNILNRLVIIKDDKVIVYIPDNLWYDADSIPTVILRFELDSNMNILDFSECDLETYNEDLFISRTMKNDSLYLIKERKSFDSDNTSSGDTVFKNVTSVYNLELNILYEHIFPEQVLINDVYPLGDYFYVAGRYKIDETLNPYFAILDNTGIVFENIISSEENDYYSRISYLSGNTLIIGGIKDDMHFVHEVDFSGNIVNEYDISLKKERDYIYTHTFKLLSRNVLTQSYIKYDGEIEEDIAIISILKFDDSFGIDDIQYSEIYFDRYRSHFVWNNYIYFFLDNKVNYQTEVYRVQAIN